MRTIKGLLTKAFTKLPFSHIRVWVDPDNNKAPILDLKGENIILKNSAVKQQIIDVISREDVDWVMLRLPFGFIKIIKNFNKNGKLHYSRGLPTRRVCWTSSQTSTGDPCRRYHNRAQHNALYPVGECVRDYFFHNLQRSVYICIHARSVV